VAVVTPELLFWMGVLFVIYVYAAYPCMLLAASAILKPVHRPCSGEPLPRLTLFVPVHNEEAILERKILNCLEIDYPPELLEIVFASDGSTDRTNDILKSRAGGRVKVHLSEANRGKNAVINEYAPLTNGEVLVFTDANAFFEGRAVKRLASHFSDARVGCVGGRLKYLSGVSGTARGEGLYFRYENLLRQLEGDRGSLVGANGAIYAIRRSLFLPVPVHVPNDFFHPLSVLKRNHLAVFDARALAVETPTEHHGEEFKRRRRIVARSMVAVVEVGRLFGIFGGRGTFYLMSHKVMRWLTFPMLVLVFAANLLLLDKTLYVDSLWLQIVFYALGALGYLLDRVHVRSRLAFVPYYFLIINIAALAGLVDFCRGQRVNTWDTAVTTRS